MSKVRLDIGATVDFLTKGELDDSLASHNEAREAARIRGIKYQRIPILTGTVSSGSCVVGVTGVVCQPDSGYAWSLRRLFVSGLAAGTLPDQFQLFRSGTTTAPVWQVNGNAPGATFGWLGFVLRGGEPLVGAGYGSLTTTAAYITVSGEGAQVPEEMLGKLS